MTQLHQSKVFANGSTTLPKPVRDALGVKAGDSIRYVIAEDGELVLKMPSEKAQADAPALREASEADEHVMDDNRTLLQDMNLISIAEIEFSGNQTAPVRYAIRLFKIMGGDHLMKLQKMGLRHNL